MTNSPFSSDSNAKDGSNARKSTLPESRWKVSKETLLEESDGEQLVPWKDMTNAQRFEHVAYILAKLATLCLVIFTFICTLALLADAFKLIGGRGIGNAMKNSHFIQNPISASIVGMVITLVLQSSSTLISILVGMISGGLISVHQAIPIMMGAEIGASFINALISLGQSGNRDQFRRAFAAATMNDVYNFVCYLVILPLEIVFGVVEWVSAIFVEPLSGAKGGGFQTLNVLTDPILNRIIQLDEEAIKEVATNPNKTILDNDSFVLRCINLEIQEPVNLCPYDHLFANSTWSDSTIGIALLVISLFLLIVCLIGIVQLLNSLLAGQVAVLVRRLMDAECPAPFQWLTNYVVMIVGCVIVMIVQSSGVFRTALIPLVGIGVVTLERLYPLLLGANMGTTFTGILASLSADPRKLRETMQIALCQTVYNLLGIIFFYPVPQLRQIPISLAEMLGDKTAKYRWFAFIYIFTVFFLMPGTLLALSFLPTPVMLTIIALLVVIFALIITINVLQTKCPKVLPPLLRSWNFLPKQLHSLSVYDRFMCHHCSRIPILRRFFNPVREEKNKLEKPDRSPELIRRNRRPPEQEAELIDDECEESPSQRTQKPIRTQTHTRSHTLSIPSHPLTALCL